MEASTEQQAGAELSVPIADEQLASPWLRGHVPGEPGIWVFIFGDMVVFAVFFAVFLVARMQAPEVFAASRPQLEVALGAINTVVLLASSLLVALGVRSVRDNARRRAALLFAGGAGCALVFLAIKVVEYSQKLGAGITPMTNDFFMYYFVFTGIHAAHVVIGLVGLTVLWHLVRRPRPGKHDMRVSEVAATFWHMVDFLWIVLFPLFYLVS